MNLFEKVKNHMATSVLLLIARIYLGWKWTTAGWGKVTGDFDASGYLHGAVAKATGEKPIVQEWWADFLSNVAIPNSDIFSFLVSYGELAVGLGLIVGLFVPLAVTMGMLMNFAFLFSGTVSSNPNMLLLGIIILLAGASASKFGLDPYVKKYFKKYSTSS